MEYLIQHLYMIPVIVSAILSLKSFRGRWPRAYQLFSLMLCAICCIEAVAITWSIYLVHLPGWPWGSSNLWLYNLFLIPQYLLYMRVYYLESRSNRIKRIILVSACVFTAFAIFNMGWLQGFNNIDSYTLTLASAIVIFMTVTWFNQLLHDKVIHRLGRHPLVWISAGAFIFHATDLPFMLSLNYLVRHNVSLAVLLFYVFDGLNFLMYTLYTIAFLCQPPPQRS